MKMTRAMDVSNSIHDRLKSATQAAHDRLEIGLPLLNPHLTLQHYRQYLCRLYGLYSPLELAMLQVRVGIPGGLKRRIKNSWLAQDLLALGETELGLSDIPRCPQLPRMQTEADLAGILYVVEGATLGGRSVVGALRQSIGTEVSRYSRFFLSYGEQVGHRWVECLQYVTSIAGRSDGEGQRIIESACATFLLFEMWLTSAPLDDYVRSPDPVGVFE